MRHFALVASFVSALGLLADSPARADLAPPPGYVETCTIENHEKDGTKKCSACSTYFREPDKCVGLMKPQGYTKVCRAGGASTWTEVWCKAKADMVPGEPEPGEPPIRPKPAKPEEPAKPLEQDGAEPGATGTTDSPTPPPEEAKPVETVEAKPVEVKAADVAPKRDGKCGAGGAGLGGSLLLALGLIARRRL